jgi:hypothetical protein
MIAKARRYVAEAAKPLLKEGVRTPVSALRERAVTPRSHTFLHLESVGHHRAVAVV